MLGYANSRLAVKIANEAVNAQKPKNNKNRSAATTSTSSRRKGSSTNSGKVPSSYNNNNNNNKSMVVNQRRHDPSGGAATFRASTTSTVSTTCASSAVSSSTTSSMTAWPAPRPSSLRSYSRNGGGTKKNLIVKKPARRPSAQAPKKLVSCFDTNHHEEPKTPRQDTADKIPKSIHMMMRRAVLDPPPEDERQPPPRQTTRLPQEEEQARTFLSAQESELQTAWTLHRGRACSRLETNNRVGALLSIKRCYKVRTQLAAVRRAMTYLTVSEDPPQSPAPRRLLLEEDHYHHHHPMVVFDDDSLTELDPSGDLTKVVDRILLRGGEKEDPLLLSDEAALLAWFQDLLVPQSADNGEM